MSLVAATSVLTAAPASAATIVGLYNTGVDNGGTVKADGADETHYTLFAAPGEYALRVATSANGFPIGPWLGDNATSAWVGPATNGQLDGAPGNYTYRTTFTLVGTDTIASIFGRWSTDDGGVDILLNGVSQGFTNGNGFTGWSNFSINSGFVTGLNTLDFVVANGGGPTGLRVEAAVPEPATWGMMILGFGMVGFGLRRRKSAVRTTVRFA